MFARYFRSWYTLVFVALLGGALMALGCKAISNKLTHWKMLDQIALEDPIKAVGGDAFVFMPRQTETPLNRRQLTTATPEVLANYYAPIFVQQRINSQALKYPYPPEYDMIGQAHLR